MTVDWDEFVGSGDNPDFKFENVGDVIQGLVTYAKVHDTKYGRRPKLVIEVDGGDRFDVWGGSVGLQRALADKDVQRGDKVRIEHTGEHDTGQGNPMKLFDVKVAKPKAAVQKPPPPPVDDGFAEEPF